MDNLCTSFLNLLNCIRPSKLEIKKPGLGQIGDGLTNSWLDDGDAEEAEDGISEEEEEEMEGEIGSEDEEEEEEEKIVTKPKAKGRRKGKIVLHH